MSLIIFSLWIAFHTFLLNIAIKAGWDFDPGYLGPSIIIFVINIIIAMYSKNRSES